MNDFSFHSRGTHATSRRDFLVAAASVSAAAMLPTDPAFGQDTRSPNHMAGAPVMNSMTTKDGVQIYYKDWGGARGGQPLVFSHGWPLSADEWDTQMMFFLNHGYRVIAHDRRGHGRSSQVSDGHDMDHYADDLAALTD